MTYKVIVSQVAKPRPEVLTFGDHSVKYRVVLLRKLLYFVFILCCGNMQRDVDVVSCRFKTQAMLGVSFAYAAGSIL